MKNEKVRILYIVSTLRQSGPTTQLLGMISNLEESIFKPSVLTLSPEPTDSMKKEFVECGIKIESLNLNRSEFFWRGNKRLERYINNYKPDIIHTSGVRADVAVSKMKINSAHCMTIRNFATDDYIAKFGPLIGKVTAGKGIKAMKKCEHVIFCSKSLKNMYENILTQETKVIQNGVNIDQYQPSSSLDNKVEIRNTLGLSEDKLIFIAVGGLIKRKDPLTIIKAFKEAEFNEKAELILLGEGPLFEKCKEESNASIILKGNVNNVDDYLKAADVYISASHSEGLPNSVLEAGSSGLDLALSNISQHREIFEDNLEFVKLFEIGDINNLRYIIDEYIHTSSGGENVKLSNYIQKNFSNAIMSRRYAELYLKIHEEKRLTTS